METKKIKAIKVKGTDTVVIPMRAFRREEMFFVNGVEVSDELKEMEIAVSLKDELKFNSNEHRVVEYTDGDTTMTTIEYQALNTYYDEDSSEEKVLNAIKNRKKLKGFKQVLQKDPTVKVEIEIIGEIVNTNSKYIECFKNPRSSNGQTAFSVNGNRISMDEYMKLKDLYKHHGVMENPDRNYLRFTKINNTFAFGDVKPFGDNQYRAVFPTLEGAEEEERSVREAVKRVVDINIFKENFTVFKREQIINNLTTIRKSKNKLVMYRLVDMLIEDIREYNNHIK